MKRILLIALLTATLFLQAACAGSGGNAVSEEMQSSSEQSAQDIPSAAEQSEPEEPGFVIVFYRFYADEADRTAAAIKEKSGVEPQTVQYSQTAEKPERAIYIGEVTDGTGDALCGGVSGRDYGVTVKDGNVYIYGGSRDSVREAAEYFAANCIDEKGVAMEKCEYAYTHNYPLKGASVNGVELSEFTVVYSATTQEAKYSDVAAEIKQYLKDNADISVKTAPATRAETEYEILLGSETGRAAGRGLYESKFRYNEYQIIVTGGKVAIVGGNACAVWHGWKAFCGLLAENGGGIEDGVTKGTCGLIKIACVGGSITEGSNSEDADKTYPDFLQKMLGFDYLVKNFGIGGYSVVSTDDYAYVKHWKYSSSVKFVPDVVIWMLGINDGNPSQAYKAWEGTDRREKYIRSAESMFSAYENANPDVQIFVTLPSSLFESKVWVEWKEWGARVEKYVIPLNRELAEKHNYPIIDVFSWAEEHPEVFPDGLHPKDSTYKTYAERVYEEIKDVIKTPA